MLEKLSTNCHWQKRTPDEALSCNLNSKDNFKFHIKWDIKYRTIYRISQSWSIETIESMNSRIADIIRNKSIKDRSLQALRRGTVFKRFLHVFVTVHDKLHTI